MAGIGANTALRDADLLRSQLIAVGSGERELIRALHGTRINARLRLRRSQKFAEQCGAGRIWQPARSGRVPHRVTRDCRSAAATTPNDQLAWSVCRASAEQRIYRCGDKKQCEIGIRPVKESHWLQRGVGQTPLCPRQ